MTRKLGRVRLEVLIGDSIAENTRYVSPPARRLASEPEDGGPSTARAGRGVLLRTSRRAEGRKDSCAALARALRTGAAVKRLEPWRRLRGLWPSGCGAPEQL